MLERSPASEVLPGNLSTNFLSIILYWNLELFNFLYLWHGNIILAFVLISYFQKKFIRSNSSLSVPRGRRLFSVRLQCGQFNILRILQIFRVILYWVKKIDFICLLPDLYCIQIISIQKKHDAFLLAEIWQVVCNQHFLLHATALIYKDLVSF